MKEPCNVLVIRTSAIGDVAMAVPVLHSVATAYPDTKFTILTAAKLQPLFGLMPPNVSVMGLEKRVYNSLPRLKELAQELSRYKFDAVADLHGVIRSRVLSGLLSLKHTRVRTIHKNRWCRWRLTRRRMKIKVQQRSSFGKYTAVFNALGFTFPLKFESIYGEGRKGDFSTIINRVGAKEKNWVGVAPFAAHEGKIYPIERMEEVVKSLDSMPQVERVYLFAYGYESKLVAEWIKRYPSTRLVSGHLLSFEQELVLLSHLDVLISMDSANMHLASVVHTPVVSVWGATHPCAGFMGWGQSPEDCVQKEMYCRPCSIYGNKPCHKGGYYCLKGISSTDVLNRVLTHINL